MNYPREQPVRSATFLSLPRLLRNPRTNGGELRTQTMLMSLPVYTHIHEALVAAGQTLEIARQIHMSDVLDTCSGRD
jgi:hypothetical protein